MPIYEYKCPKCGVFEITQRITENALKKCPTCKSKVERMISATSFVLKGSGWYATDYASKPKTESSSDSAAPSSTSSTSDASANGSSTSDNSGAAKTSTAKDSPAKTSSAKTGGESSKGAANAAD